ncbi:uncharacterized protein LOC118513353 [Anopheles stephensi]|uniref:uncharacterized protein LOC118513352 n=1 Tax=Anopheles stephensi TaxID=30069 RepID=UPI001658B251|nr:uncharacterized protein LOC118513352 [Anopheles stephensi]XP_035914878.1 uncharacterized protein LOC118513353 [Anopheles stephensi]
MERYREPGGHRRSPTKSNGRPSSAKAHAVQSDIIRHRMARVFDSVEGTARTWPEWLDRRQERRQQSRLDDLGLGFDGSARFQVNFADECTLNASSSISVVAIVFLSNEGNLHRKGEGAVSWK